MKVFLLAGDQFFRFKKRADIHDVMINFLS